MVFLIVTNILFMILNPPNDPEHSVVSTSLSSFNLTTFPAHLSSDSNFALSVRNTNKKFSMHYDSMNAVLLYRRITITQGSIPKFRQPGKNTTTMETRLEAVDVYLLPEVASTISSDLATHKASVFDLIVSRKISVRASDPPVDLMVQCKGITVWFPTPDAGSLMGQSKSCEVQPAAEWQPVQAGNPSTSMSTMPSMIDQT